MRARHILAAGTAAFALAGSVFAATPALAACGAGGSDVCTGSTVATFTLTGGALQISVPSGDATTPDTLGGANANSGDLSVSGSLGAVSVDDQRAALVAAWAVSVDSTNFDNITTAGGSAQETVLNAAVGYDAGLLSAATTSGNGVLTPLSAASLAAAAPAASWTGVGINSASWNPTISFTLLPDQVAGTYEGTITHTLV
jgi:hypothetical protein